MAGVSVLGKLLDCRTVFVVGEWKADMLGWVVKQPAAAAAAAAAAAVVGRVAAVAAAAFVAVGEGHHNLAAVETEVNKN